MTIMEHTRPRKGSQARGALGYPPALLADALRDGRVLVDRDGLWALLKRREPSIRRAAEHRDPELLERGLQPLETAR